MARNHDARVRYEVPDDVERARREFHEDPWVSHIVRFAAERAGVSGRDVVDGRHRNAYDVPIAFLCGPGFDAERVRDVTPPSVTVRE